MHGRFSEELLQPKAFDAVADDDDIGFPISRMLQQEFLSGTRDVFYLGVASV